MSDYECRIATGMAMTGSGDNDTPAQSQSERDKTVAGNEGGSARAGAVKFRWSGTAARRLMSKKYRQQNRRID